MGAEKKWTKAGKDFCLARYSRNRKIGGVGGKIQANRSCTYVKDTFKVLS